MCDAAGELPDRLHLLRLSQLLFGRALFRHIAGHFGKSHQVAPLVMDRMEHDTGPELRAVLADAPAFALVFAGGSGSGNHPIRQSTPPVFLGIEA